MAAFDDTQRDVVRARILEAAHAHLTRYGYRRTNVAELARAAGIGKGTLYLFFPSKAQVFMEVALEVEAEVRARLLAELAGPFASRREMIARYLRSQFDVLREHPLLAVLTDPEESRALMRDLPPGALEELSGSDDRFFGGIIEEWQRRGEVAAVDARAVAALSRAIYAMSLQRQLIGEEVFPAVVDLIIESVSRLLAVEATS
jgi:AcrR family transcriptional regulator